MEVIAGLDIGTTKVCIIVGQVDSDGKVSVIAKGSSPSVGLRKGIIVDVDRTIDAICEAKEAAEAQCGFRIRSAFVGIAGGHLTSVNNQAEVRIFNRHSEITDDDLENVLAAVRAINIPDDAEIIHVLPREFVVDGNRGIKQPVGMYGNHLAVQAHVVLASITSVQNIVRSCERASIQVEDVVLQPIASGEAVLSESEKELGVILVDIGGGTTDVAIFDEGTIWHTAVVPVGGNHITNDIAVGLRTPVPSAEELKKQFGAVLPDAITDVELQVPDMTGSDSNKASSRFLCEIIEARVREIFELVNNEIRDSGSGSMIPCGMVLTGGTSMMRGIVGFVSNTTGYPVRLGLPDHIYGDDVRNPIYATGVGLLQYGVRRYLRRAQEKPIRFSVDSLVRTVKSWFREFF